MLISAQWEIVKGNSFAYTVLSAFGILLASAISGLLTITGLFYAGFGAIITPAFGVTNAYAGDTAQYNNALGFWVLRKGIILFSIRINDLQCGQYSTQYVLDQPTERHA